MAKTFTIANPSLPATSNQTFAIFCLRKGLKMTTGDTRSEGFTMGTASVEIGRLIALKEAAKAAAQTLTGAN